MTLLAIDTGALLVVVVGIFGGFCSTCCVLGLKWFYRHMTANMTFHNYIERETTNYTNEVANLKDDIKKSHEGMVKMVAEELHPLSTKVKRLKKGLNGVEDQNKLPRTSFEDLDYDN